MKINKIELKNYRIHNQIEVTFDRGINLLLGKNGTGKSSILEALGFALFDADLRSSQNDAIKKGHKSATIKVEIEGNDNNEYIVERKLGSSSNLKLYLKGDKSERLEGKEPVLLKIKELAGITSNEKNLYQNVITAYQNKIVDIFNETPANRERIFNHIFDTAIYQQMFDKYAKDVRDHYKSNCQIEIELLKKLKDQIKDSKTLKRNLKEQKNIRKNELEIANKINKNIKEKESSKQNLEKAKNNIEKTLNEIKHNQELSELKISEKIKSSENLSASEAALKVTQKNHVNYEKYVENNTNLTELNKRILPLEKLAIEKDILKEKLNLLEKNEQKNIQDQKHLKEKISDNQIYISKLDDNLKAITNEIEIMKNELSEVTETGKSNSYIFERFTNQYDSLKKYRENKTIKSIEIELLEKNCINIDLCKVEIDKLLEHKSQLQNNFLLKEKIESKISSETTKLLEIEQAENILGKNICPYLKEECLNIKAGTSPAEYFSVRKKEINQILEKLKTEKKQYENLSIEITKCDQQLAKLQNNINKDKENKDQINNLEKEKLLIIEEIKNSEIEIKKILKPIKDETELLLNNQDFNQINVFLSDKRAQLLSDYSALNKNLNSKQTELTNNTNEKNIYLENAGKLKKQLLKTESEYKKLLKDKNNISENIESLKNELNELPKLKEKRNIVSDVLLKLKQGYDNYLENINKANELETYKNQIKELNNDLKKITINQKKLNEKLKNFEEAYSEDSYTKLCKELDEIILEKENKLKVVAETDTQIALINRELEENIKLEQQYNENQQLLQTLEKKLALTNKFRNNLKGMGKLVAARLMNQIESAATINYNKISGKSESIRWVNSESESYTVFLCKGTELESSRRFELLSGGEQVAVALSIRAAMASLLTKSNFAIFDEPTINLDSEKRIALAESLKQILNKLKQAIIVTHDDTFREMAQKTISLDDINN